MVRDSTERHRDDKFVEGGGEEEDGEDGCQIRRPRGVAVGSTGGAASSGGRGGSRAAPVVVDGAGIPPILWPLVVFIE